MNTTHDRRSGHRGRRKRAMALPVVGALGMTLLSGCQQVQQSLTIGDMSSAYNREILWMSIGAIILSIIIFVGVSYALFYTVARFREDRHDAPPAQFHGNNKLEVWLVVVPVIIVVFLSVISVKSLATLNPTPPQTVAKLDVLGRQFWWNFSYPAAQVQSGGVVINGNEMVMPTKQPVELTVTSGDVIHGFWAPNIGGQRAAMPSVKKSWTVDTDRQAVYQGNCSQLCGASHANMRYKVIALDQERYDAFLNGARNYRAPVPAPGSPEERGYQLFLNGKPATQAAPCATCHRVQGTPANGANGPDLSFFGTRRTLGAGMWEGVKAQEMLIPWLKHSPKVKPGSLMPTYDGSEYRVAGKVLKGGVLTDEEIADIAAYLRSLKLPEEADYWRDVPVIGAPTQGGTQ